MAQKKKSASRKKRPSPKKASRTSGRPVKLVLFCLCIIGLCAGLYLYRYPGTIERLRGSMPKALTERFKKIATVPTKNEEIRLFFGNEYAEQLVMEKRTVKRADTPEIKAEILLRELLAGPRTPDSILTIPEGTRVRSVAFDKNSRLLTVDFSREISTRHPGGTSSELLTVYAVVNTLTAGIDEVKKVKLLIGGKTADTLAGHIDCRNSFVFSSEMVHAQ